MKYTSFCSLALALALFGCGDDGSTPGNDGGTGGDTTTGSDAGPGGEVEVAEAVTADTTWTADNTYFLTDKIFVTDGATLTIEAGTQVLGEDGAALVVTREGSINAVGTTDAPIVFSSAVIDGSRATGDWAGLALLGDASINQGSCNGDGDPGTAEVCDAPGFFEGRVEGIDVADDRGLFGGSNDSGSCGTLQYVRIEFAGAELSTDNELNGLTLGGCGSTTSLSYIQVHRGKDDGIEFFGGTAGMDHVVITGASDDSLDWDLGWRGQVQFLIVHQFPGAGDNGFEADNLGSDESAEPRSNPTLFNVTMVGTPETRGMVLREGTLGTLRNFIVTGFGSEALDLRAEQVDLTTMWPSMLSIENSFMFMNGEFAVESGEDDDDMGFVEADAVTDAARNNIFDADPMLGDASATAPNYVPANTDLGGQATPTFGDTAATYAGAVEPGGTSWSEGWTAYPEN